MVWNLIRLVILFWVIRVIYKWYRGYNELQRRRQFDAGRRAERNKDNPKFRDDAGDYIDYEELK
jgi:hypothetical protein